MAKEADTERRVQALVSVGEDELAVRVPLGDRSDSLKRPLRSLFRGCREVGVELAEGHGAVPNEDSVEQIPKSRRPQREDEKRGPCC